MALELTGDVNNAITLYDQVAVLLTQRNDESQDQLINWAEEALYRVALLKVRIR